MASVVKSSSANGNRYYIQLSPSEDENRPKISLGRIARKDANTTKGHIENLVRQKLGATLPISTVQWLEDIPGSLRKRLERLQLASPKTGTQWTVAGWVQNYIDSRPDVKAGTRRKYEDVQAKLKVFFRDDLISDVTVRAAKNFRVYLKDECELSENSVRRQIGIARQFFNAAIEAEVITKNPFRGQPVGVRANHDRHFYVTRDIADQVINSCPSAEWRLIFGLARYGGLRCPSEVIALRWTDVDFENDKFTVRSPKTAHHESGGVRVVPIFPELKPLFQDAFEQAKDGAVYCIDSCGGKWSNLSTTMKKIVQRAGVEPWPKLFVNCRSTRATELIKETGNLRAVCTWLGHSEQIALKHYQQLTDADYRDAVKKTVIDEAEKRVHDRVHDNAVCDGTGRNGSKKEDDVNPCGDGTKPQDTEAYQGVQNDHQWAILDLNQ